MQLEFTIGKLVTKERKMLFVFDPAMKDSVAQVRGKVRAKAATAAIIANTTQCVCLQFSDIRLT